MPDREKVIKALECCDDKGSPNCEQCPYMDDDFVGTCASRNPLFRDALALLKGQEPIPCGEKIKAGDVVLDFYECGYCKNAIRKPWRYCPFCGKAVKWDD